MRLETAIFKNHTEDNNVKTKTCPCKKPEKPEFHRQEEDLKRGHDSRVTSQQVAFLFPETPANSLVVYMGGR